MSLLKDHFLFCNQFGNIEGKPPNLEWSLIKTVSGLLLLLTTRSHITFLLYFYCTLLFFNFFICISIVCCIEFFISIFSLYYFITFIIIILISFVPFLNIRYIFFYGEKRLRYGIYSSFFSFQKVNT